MKRPAAIIAGLLAIPAAAILLLGRGDRTQASGDLSADPVERFLRQHWQHPLPPQGTPPSHFSALEASLDPAACGQCHRPQFEDWQQSLHSQTMGAGVLWQFRLMSQQDANQCMNCHAPLAEQKALMAIEHGWSGAPAQPPPDYVPDALGHGGLVCAACHVRAHERFGPPAETSTKMSAPHGGFTPSAAFEDSRFCASCHQFPDDGPRTAGKLREDTWRQWQASAFAERGETCQSCHMPDRRHQWQGIHAPHMVEQALTPTLAVTAEQVTATLTNTGAGHDFPTYMVPKVTAQLVWIGDTEVLLKEAVIGWQVDVFLETESFDTRIPAGGSISLSAALPAQRDATQPAHIELRLQVAPREHYERTFLSVLAQAEQLDEGTLALLQQAYDEARATRYDVLLLSEPLPRL